MSPKRSSKRPRVPPFSSAFPHFWNKLQSDSALKPRDRDDFKKHCRKLSKGTLRDHATAFFRSHKLMGEPVSLATPEILGSVRARSALIRRLQENSHLTRRQAMRILEHWIALDAKNLKTEIKDMLENEMITLNLIMWSFRNDNQPLNPFYGIVINDLPCQLGLPSFGKEDHYAFGHILAAGEQAHTPTAFDGEFDEQWEPGGFTKPHDACKMKYPVGLPEVVHNPNKFENISTKLFEAPK